VSEPALVSIDGGRTLMSAAEFRRRNEAVARQRRACLVAYIAGLSPREREDFLAGMVRFHGAEAVERLRRAVLRALEQRAQALRAADSWGDPQQAALL